MSIRRQHGLTIIELVMFMVIMGVAAASIIGVLNLGTKSSADPLRRKQAMLIAEAYMEEIQSARFTFCVPGDAKELDATKQGDCGAQVAVGPRAAMARPYANVADYATAFDTPQPTFAVNGVDRDINGRALGQDRNLKTMGNQPLDGITTTVTLSLLDTAAKQLGPASLPILSTVPSLEALQITVVTRYGAGANDVIRLDGYRTRYAPND